MKIFGFTGGSGAGKTTVLNTIKKYGALVIDCDALYHDMLKNDKQLLNELYENFSDSFTENGLDRKKLGSLVFNDSNKLELLNDITHKRVKQKVVECINSYESIGGSLAAIDAIGLFESGLAELCNETFYITAPKEIRIQRIMKRDNISYEYAKSRIDAQKPDEYFEKLSSGKIVNDFNTKQEFEDYCIEYFNEKVK